MRCTGPCYCTGACRNETYNPMTDAHKWPRPETPVVVPHQPTRKIKAIEYHPDGTVKRIEYFEDQPNYIPVIR